MKTFSIFQKHKKTILIIFITKIINSYVKYISGIKKKQIQKICSEWLDLTYKAIIYSTGMV